MNTQTAAAVPDNYLSINNIEVIYDHVILVLKGVSLNVPKGKIVALLGANGAGTSTTLKAISKRPAAFPAVLVTSSEKGTGMPELRAEIMRSTGVELT